MKKILWLIITSVILTLITSACKLPEVGNINDSTEPGLPLQKNIDDVMDQGPIRGGVLKLYSTQPASNILNPVINKNSYIEEYSSLIFDSLVKLDRNQKPMPCLADEWTIAEDGLTWNFHIRENVFWHDHVPVTADDVSFTFETILNMNVDTIYKENLKNIITFAAIDRNNFRLTLSKKNSFTAEMMTFPILPRHYYMGEDFSSPEALKNKEPLGSGMYKYRRSQKERVISLVCNDKWWGLQKSQEGETILPYIPEINILIGTNEISAFEAENTDLAFVKNREINRFIGRSGLILKKFPSENFEFIALNLSKPVVKEKAVRQAMMYAMDKAKLIDKFLPGQAIPSDIPVIPDTWLYDTNVTSYTPDIAKAREILMEDGWKDINGILYKNLKGIMTPLKLEILVNTDNDIRCRVADELAVQFKNAGINLKVVRVDWNEELERINKRKFDLAFLGWNISSIPDVSFAYASTEIGSGTNVSGYNNPAVDEYLVKILEEKNESMKKAYFINMKEMIMEDVPYLGLYFYNNAVIYNKRLKGEMNPYVWNRLDDLMQWYIPIK